MSEPGEPLTGGAATTAANVASSTIAEHPTSAAPNENQSDAIRKKDTTKRKRKLSANKQAGITNRKRSVAWDHFKRVPDEEVREPTAECIHYGIRFLCSSKEYGTSNMLGHIPKCPKNTFALRNDPKQQVLDFEKKIWLFNIGRINPSCV